VFDDRREGARDGAEEAVAGILFVAIPAAQWEP
jgi:hypothetical protein